MAALRDEDIEKELEMMFGLPEDPDDSEDGYEADDPDTNLNLTRVFEDEDLFEHQGSSASGPGLVPSPIPGTSLDENWENVSPNIERFERQSQDSPIRAARYVVVVFSLQNPRRPRKTNHRVKPQQMMVTTTNGKKSCGQLRVDLKLKTTIGYH
ncbi:unnamed protein product [Parnassius apollo]|uniref:(apollo) hypothetical protein n=1 Tax=Parnassius apollo TaxID=110799 RepID=A0A8S3YCF0_PARAO|nr:unnamed protein product [Parnassius apollo]